MDKSFLKPSDVTGLFSSKTDINFNSSYIYRTLTIPFAPVWTFGVDVTTTFLNLTKHKSDLRIFYTVSQVGIIYNHSNKDMQFLMGHRNLITYKSMDASGKWLVTADKDPGHSIIVWDSDACFPVCTMFDPHPPEGVAVVEISPDAKYLVSIGLEENTVVKFWQWTFGNDEADGSFTLSDKKCGEALECCFNPNETTHFAITFTDAMVFGTWKDNKLEHKIFTTEIKQKYGSLTTSVYIPYSHDCLTATREGWVIVWGLFFSQVPYEDAPDNNDKIFIKAIRLQKSSIHHIRYIDGCIATSGAQMGIKFYDLGLKLLYVCLEKDIKPTIAIHFNIRERKFVVKDPEVLDSDRTGITLKGFKKQDIKEEPQTEETVNKLDETSEYVDLNTSASVPEKETVVYYENTMMSQEITEIEDEDRSEEYDHIYIQLLQKDFTLQKAPFLIRDFVILTNTGDFNYVDMLENKVYTFLRSSFTGVTCIDTHSEKPIISVGFEDGWVYCYNYESCDIIQQIELLSSNQGENNEITCIKYSPEGFYLVASSARGHLFFLNTVTLEFEKQKQFKYTDSKIIDIVFSENNDYLAYYDEDMGVTVMKVTRDKVSSKWEFYGRCIAHNEPITGILFCRDNRLFTISEDQFLVEYYTAECQPGNLDIISRIRILQKGYPITFITYDVLTTEDTIYFLVATSEFKYIIISERTSSVERTILGPVIEDRPVSEINIIPNTDNSYMIFKAGKYLGIQLLPLSGNPYKQISLVAHSDFVQNFKISNCGKYVFTFGDHESGVIMWNIKPKSVDIQTKTGGTALIPYYSLIEGGKDGWLFKEIIDLFYYVQILHQGEDYPFTRNVNDKIPTCELPNLMRAIGYFPTEFELDNILYEVKSYYINETNEDEDDGTGEINFENFVKLYLNHRSVRSISKAEIESAFEILGIDGKINRNNFFEILCTKGEQFTSFTLEHCLSILTHQDTYGFTINLLPEELTSEYFIKEILGVNDK